ncbi:MAG: hypothetical protein QOF52_903, partial [Propionibacteriaceae bacterium]|nr:hypothetical protein [Propionibacteriaceae bacterium]
MNEGVRRHQTALRIFLVTGIVTVMAVVAVGGTSAAVRDPGV